MLGLYFAYFLCEWYWSRAEGRQRGRIQRAIAWLEAQDLRKEEKKKKEKEEQRYMSGSGSGVYGGTSSGESRKLLPA